MAWMRCSYTGHQILLLPLQAHEEELRKDMALPHHDPEKWELFKKYNERDVLVEMQIQERLKNYPVPDFVWDEYHLDQEINDRGIMIDQEMVRQALRIDELSRTDLTARMQKRQGWKIPALSYR